MVWEGTMNEKTIFAMYVIAIVAINQGIAWFLGFNGAVWAFTSLIIGLTSGAVLGFKFPSSK